MSERCKQCGSEKVIPEVFVKDSVGDYGHIHGALSVRIEGNPEAWVFKDALNGQLVARVCGECGHAEFRVKNPRELYEKFLQARGQAGQ